MAVSRLLALGLFLAMGWGGGAPARAQSAPPAAPCPAAVPHAPGPSAAFVSGSNALGFRLPRSLLDRQPSSNVFLSPLSAELALGMTYDGARGEMARAMARTLGLGTLGQAAARRQAAALLSDLAGSHPNVELDLADDLWTGVPLAPDFVREVERSYGARVLPMAPPSAINGWVRCATHGTITSMIPQIPPCVALYLLDAVYFHGAWTTPFDPTRTRQATFQTGRGGSVRVPLMDRDFRSVPAYDNTTVQMAALAGSAWSWPCPGRGWAWWRRPASWPPTGAPG